MVLDKQLKKLLKREGINASQLSKETDIPVQTLHNWLSGAEPRSLNQVHTIADYFDVSIDYLCFGITSNKQKPIEDFTEEINAGVFEVVLRRVKK